ncbi:hypothetical protein D3C81_2277110 [compost metagenome]
MYGVHDAPLVEGMSGGPVRAADGSIIGINVGFYSTTFNDVSWSTARDAQRMTIFVPYSVIEREWSKFVAGAHYAAQ